VVTRLLYADASALAKLIVAEACSEALAAYVADAAIVTCTLAMVEVARAAARRIPAAIPMVSAASSRWTVVAPDDDALARAMVVRPASVRTLDAIHIGVALGLVPDIDAFLTYDIRQAEAARAAGLPVEAPGVTTRPGDSGDSRERPGPASRVGSSADGR
jgi:uncharacterized protein